MRERQLLHQLKNLCFSAAQISTKLENIEATKNFTFRKRDILRKRLHEDFDQFEISVRNQAALMSEFYEVTYYLEVSIRSVVAEALEEDFKEAVESEPNKNEKNSWWEGVRISDEIRKKSASDNKKRARLAFFLDQMIR